MIDYAEKERQQFVSKPDARMSVVTDSYDSRATKVEALRLRMHREGRALLGEEVLAKKFGMKPFKYKNDI